MPRRGNRPATWQDQFRKRLVAEQASQGVTDQGLAARVSEKYPMTASALWKIKNANPPRKVDLDEVMALIDALGYADLAGFIAGRGPDAKLDAAVRQAEGSISEVRLLTNRTERLVITGLGYPDIRYRNVQTASSEGWDAVVALWGAEQLDRDTALDVIATLDQHAEFIAEFADSFKDWSQQYIGNVRRLADAIKKESD